VPYFTGAEHPAGRRLADIQRCLRTVDIDEVGDAWHLTCFEMRGTWSLGDCFSARRSAGRWSGSPGRWDSTASGSAVWVWAGDDEVAFDAESYERRLELGLPAGRTSRYGREENIPACD
jgi:alanyl-tRNA synthetase